MRGTLLAFGAAVLLAHGTSSAITEVQLTDIIADPEQGFRFEASGFVGALVATGIGDFNGDGLDDFATTDAFANVRVVFGSLALPGTLESSELDGSNGFELVGLNSQYSALGAVGDINGDGFDDFAVGIQKGEMFVFYGTNEPMAPSNDIRQLHQTGKAFRIFGGILNSIAGAGDMNGDGIDDLHVGTFSQDNEGISVAAILFGAREGFPADLTYDDIQDGRGIVFKTSDWWVGNGAGIGDIDGDGIDDCATMGSSTVGPVCVLYGSRTLTAGAVSEDWFDGTNGFTIEQAGSTVRRLFYVKEAGDLTGSETSNFITTTHQTELDEAEAHLWIGNRPTSSTVTLGDTDHFVTFKALDVTLVLAPGPAGDFSFKGRPPLLIGNRLGLNENGLVLALQDPPLDEGPQLLNNYQDLNGTVYYGYNVQSVGTSASSGDFNGDGLSDLLISARHHPTKQNTGLAGVVFGHTDETSATYKAYVPTGETPLHGIAELRSGIKSSPESRFWISYDSGHNDVGSASLQTVKLHRNSDMVHGLRNKTNVLWHTSSNRVGWNQARIMVKYVGRDIEGLHEEDLVLYHASSPEGPWTRCDSQILDTKRDRISGVAQELGYFTLAAPPSGDITGDGALDSADLARFQYFILNPHKVWSDIIRRGDLAPDPSGDGEITSEDLEVAREMLLNIK